MNFESIKAGFLSYLQEKQGVTDENSSISYDNSAISIFMYSSEFKDYLSEEYNADVSIFSKSINEIMSMDIVNGQLVDAESSGVGNEYVEIMIEAINEVLSDESVINALDSDGSGDLSEEEINAFYNSGESSLDDLAHDLQSIESGEYTAADIGTNVTEETTENPVTDTSSETEEATAADTTADISEESETEENSEASVEESETAATESETTEEKSEAVEETASNSAATVDDDTESSTSSTGSSGSSNNTGSTSGTGSSGSTGGSGNTGSSGSTASTSNTSSTTSSESTAVTLEDLEEQKSQLETDISSLRDEKDAIYSGEGIEEEQKAYDDAKEAYDEAVKNDENIPDGLKQQREENLEAIETSKSNIDELKININDTEGEISTTESEINSDKSNITALENSLSTLESQKSSIESEGEDGDSEKLAEIKAKIAEVEQEKIDAEEKLSQDEAALDDLNNTLDGYNDSLTDEEDNLEQLEKEREEIENSITSGTWEDSSGNTVSFECSDEVKETLAAFNEAKTALETAKSEQESAISEIESEISSKQTELDDVNSQIDEMKAEETEKENAVSVSSIDMDVDIEENLTDSQKAELEKIKEIYEENQETYEDIAAQVLADTGVSIPAEAICAIHYRESSCNFNTYLHNGQTLGQTTTIVPKGIYFEDFTEAAVDALERNIDNYTSACATYGVEDTDCSAMSGVLMFCESYNGTGYRKHGCASAYVYSGTTTYTGGMYVSDGNFSSSTYDSRCGTAIIIKTLMEMS
ncbi:MAG: hypothetical protein LUH05_08595 [Candidatus Gastranaerophilales bacterium]|nr:hypothetical protein [Candidatus Gastranaerophilales bacterium]